MGSKIDFLTAVLKKSEDEDFEMSNFNFILE